MKNIRTKVAEIIENIFENSFGQRNKIKTEGVYEALADGTIGVIVLELIHMKQQNLINAEDAEYIIDKLKGE